IVASPVLIVSMFKTRAPGMSINRIPLFVWSIIVMAFMMYFAFIPVFIAGMFLQFDRKFGTHFYDTNYGGSALLWQHLFCLLGHPKLNSPFFFIVGFFVTFVLGGIAGVMVAVVPFDWQVHDSYFVVAHFHFVLIGAVVFPIIAAVFYWFPKYMGRMLSDRLGRISFWLVFVGLNVTFFPLHILGLLGMP